MVVEMLRTFCSMSAVVSWKEDIEEAYGASRTESSRSLERCVRQFLVARILVRNH